MQAWSPLSAGQNDLFHNEILCKIGVAHGKSAAQVVLRWLTQRGHRAAGQILEFPAYEGKSGHF